MIAILFLQQVCVYRPFGDSTKGPDLFLGSSFSCKTLPHILAVTAAVEKTFRQDQPSSTVTGAVGEQISFK